MARLASGVISSIQRERNARPQDFVRGCRAGPPPAVAGGGRKGVLLVLAALEQPTLATVDRLAHEYSFKDELDGTWAVRPLELVQDRGQTILVLEDPGGELLGTPMEVGRFLRIAVAPEQTGANTPAEWPEEAVFEIVNQLDRSAGVMTSDVERKQLAEFKSRDLG